MIEPLLNNASYELITVYQKASDVLIALFALLSIYTGVRGLEMATKRTHKTIYVTAICLGVLAIIQFLLMGLPAIVSQ